MTSGSTDDLLPRVTTPDDAPSLVMGAAEPWSYRDLRGAADVHRRRAEAAGLRAGDRVAVVADKTPGTLAAIVGNALGGFVSVPINPKLGTSELRHVLVDAAPRAIVAVDPGALPAEAPDTRWTPPELSPVAHRLTTARRAVDDEPLLVLYTSGTTGAPKGTVLTARNVAASLDGLADAWRWSERDAIVHALPIFHVHGLVLGFLGALRSGGMLSWLPSFASRRFAAAISHIHRMGSHRVVVFAVPTIHQRMADAAAGDPEIAAALRLPRLLVSGSAGLPLREHRRLSALAEQPVLERYGLTETLINTACRVDEPPTPGTVGPPLPGVALRLVDDAGAPLPEPAQWDGETLGEIEVRGDNVFSGYLGQPDATRAVLDDEGWFRTGDLGCRDRRGHVRIAGRRSVDLIKTGGYRVGAGEVEGALLEHPAVCEVAVVGEPDPDLGERIVAHVVLSEEAQVSDDELVGRVAETLAPHKRPRAIVRRGDLPRNAMGKVLKRRLGGAER